MRALVIEDDPKLQKLLGRGLGEEGFSVDLAADGEEGLHLAGTVAYDAIVLDLMLPRLSGTRVLERLRAGSSHVPVLILTACDSDEQKVAGLNAGADDYVTKPFTFTELVARLRALIRRAHRVTQSVIRIADLEIDTAARRVTRGGRLVTLPAKQYALLEYLALNRDRVVDRDRIYRHIYSFDSDTLSSVVDVHICRLRDAIDRDSAVRLIHTVRGQGYVLRENER